MRWPLLVGTALASLVVGQWLFGCDGDPAAVVPLDGGAPEAAPTAMPDAGPPPPWGLDTRPPNPTCKAPARPAPKNLDVAIVEPYPTLPRFTTATDLQRHPTLDRFYVVEQGGLVRTFTPPSTNVTVAIDVSAILQSGSEAGLLGLAFHPKFAQNHYVYLDYTVPTALTPTPEYPVVFDQLIVRYTSPDDGLTFDPASATLIKRTHMPGGNHNGGRIVFGPDGYLYAAIGDGGLAQWVQDKAMEHGKILRIDVDAKEPYGIPPSNPFIGVDGALPEIYALGFRNPFRMSFDRATGELWEGDVGEITYEEVNRIRPGGNYGWPVREGHHCYDGYPCDPRNYQDPYLEIPHPTAVSIAAGYVYRGTRIPALYGKFVFGDFGGFIWTIDEDPVTLETKAVALDDTFSRHTTAFMEDLAGELYGINYFGGEIFQLAPRAATPPSTFPTRLSKTGCVDPANPAKLAPGVVPYDLRVPFWSDGADKGRAFAIPDGTKIDVDPKTGDLALPIGSVVLKTFQKGGKPVETRLMVRHDDGGWAGYSYEWQGNDAVLLEGSKDKDLGAGDRWYFPSRIECVRCHTRAAGFTLGLEASQLDTDVTYAPGRTANQRTTLDHIGILAQPLPSVPSLPRLGDSAATPASRAAAFLHVNCSQCHQPDNRAGSATMDLRFGAADPQVCNVDPKAGDLGIEGAKLVGPGSPQTSVLFSRAGRRDVHGMPPLGSRSPSPEGVDLLRQWITGLTACP
jgi:uncharacterized repeat protein (TIGR03806 family)